MVTETSGQLTSDEDAVLTGGHPTWNGLWEKTTSKNKGLFVNRTDEPARRDTKKGKVSECTDNCRHAEVLRCHLIQQTKNSAFLWAA